MRHINKPNVHGIVTDNNNDYDDDDKIQVGFDNWSRRSKLFN